MKSLFNTLKKFYRVFGAESIWVLPLVAISKAAKIGIRYKIKIDGNHHLWLRLDSSDIIVYESIFLDGEFQIDLPDDPRFIIDAGAYTGISSVYFAMKYPKATIVAIEPESSNFGMLSKNVSAFPNIKPLNKGLWGAETHLSLVNPRKKKWKYRTFVSFRTVTEDSPDATRIQTTTIDAIRQSHDNARIDLLKIDIEGSEIEVLASSKSWMPEVTTILVELHDNFRAGCTDAFEASTKDFAFSEKRGEKVIRSRVPVHPGQTRPGRIAGDEGSEAGMPRGGGYRVPAGSAGTGPGLASVQG